MQSCVIKRVSCPLNLPAHWTCWESVLKNCTLMRIETLDDLFRTSSAKWICLLPHYAYPAHASVHILLFDGCHLVCDMLLANSLHSTQKICSDWGGGNKANWVFKHMKHLPMWYSDILQEWSLETKPFSLEHSRTLLTGRSCCHTHAMHMCSMVTVHSLLTAMLFYSCYASCFSIAFHNNRIWWCHEQLYTSYLAHLDYYLFCTTNIQNALSAYVLTYVCYWSRTTL